MKNTIYPIAFIFFICSFTNLSSQDEAWERIQMLPQEHDLRSVSKIPGTDRIVAAGAGATIMFSEDEGNNWEIMLNPGNIPNSTVFTEIQFYNSTLGFASTMDGKVLRSIDEGQNWEVIYTLDNYNTSEASYWPSIPSDMCILDSQTIFIVGFEGQILKSSNGGDQWENYTCAEDFIPYGIDFINSDTGFIVGASSPIKMLKTIDRGNTWTVAQTEIDSLMNCQDIVFINDSIGFISGFRYSSTGFKNMIYKTIDAGNTWYTTNTAQVGTDMGDIHFKNDSVGAVITYSWWNGFLFTDDGGETWVYDDTSFFSLYQPCYSFYFTNEYLFGVGQLGRIGRLNSVNENWELLSTEWSKNRFTKVQFTNPQVGYFCTYLSNGGDDEIYKTINGGKNWERFGLPEALLRSDFSFVNDNVGFVITYDNFYSAFFIWGTINGGAEWSNLSAIEKDYFFPEYRASLTFYDSINGLAALSDELLRTTDGGINWQTVLDFDDDVLEINDITYYSQDTVFLTIGYTHKPVIIKSFDGGNTFEFDTLDLNWYNTTKVYFPNKRNGYLLINEVYDDDTGYIYKTIDGGESWYNTVINDTNAFSIRDIFFPSEEIGFAVGSGAYNNLLKTEDGGETWNPIDTYCTSVLSDLYFFDDWHGLAFGNNGVILETFSGGIVGINENPYVANRSDLLVYPNPAKDFVQIKLDEPLAQHLFVEVYSLKGECLIKKSNPVVVSQNTIRIDLSALPTGIYYCRIVNGNTVSTSKVLKF